MHLVLLLAACAEPEPLTDTSSPGDTGALATTPLPDPSWGSDEVKARIDLALSLGLPDPVSLLAAFQAMWEGADDACPQVRGEYSMSMAVSFCESDAGWVYFGVSTYEPEDDGGFWLLGDGSITDAEGQEFVCAGEIELEREQGEVASWDWRLTGTWGYPGAELGWLVPVPGLALWASGDGTSTIVDGAYGRGDVEVFFSALTQTQGCTTGAISLRDPGGSWYTLTLDGSCDGCGAITYGGEALGETCVNIEAAMTNLAARME